MPGGARPGSDRNGEIGRYVEWATRRAASRDGCTTRLQSAISFRVFSEIKAALYPEFCKTNDAREQSRRQVAHYQTIPSQSKTRQTKIPSWQHFSCNRGDCCGFGNTREQRQPPWLVLGRRVPCVQLICQCGAPRRPRRAGIPVPRRRVDDGSGRCGRSPIIRVGPPHTVWHGGTPIPRTCRVPAAGSSPPCRSRRQKEERPPWLRKICPDAGAAGKQHAGGQGGGEYPGG